MVLYTGNAAFESDTKRKDGNEIKRKNGESEMKNTRKEKDLEKLDNAIYRFIGKLIKEGGEEKTES